MGLAYLAPLCLPLVPKLLQIEQLDGLELQETGPGMPAFPSILNTPGDTEGGAVGCYTATCLLGRSQLVFSPAFRFFLAVLLD